MNNAEESSRKASIGLRLKESLGLPEMRGKALRQECSARLGESGGEKGAGQKFRPSEGRA